MYLGAAILCVCRSMFSRSLQVTELHALIYLSRLATESNIAMPAMLCRTVQHILYVYSALQSKSKATCTLFMMPFVSLSGIMIMTRGDHTINCLRYWLQWGLVKYHRAFLWHSPYGLAYNYTIAAMSHSLHNRRIRDSLFNKSTEAAFLDAQSHR
jgi:hypothetical protein